MIRIGFICPTYDALNLHAYTAASLVTFFQTTPGGVAIVVDDGSPGWSAAYEDRLEKLIQPYAGCELHVIRFEQNGGLTRSWNAGLQRADEIQLDYAIAGNNDVLFTPRWYEGLLHALSNGYALAGPLSNAPGITAQGKQDIERYVPEYKLSDNSADLLQLADRLYRERLGQVVKSPINGFFQIASMDSWRKGKYDKQHFYRPINRFTSKGRRNPTPLMTMNEDELQSRWSALGLQSAIVLSSFIFHYRAVSRGDRYKRGKWFRKV